MGLATIKTETGLNQNTTYTRYVWAYVNTPCQISTPITLVQYTLFTCGSTFTINHLAGSVAPVNKTVTYATVTNVPGESSKCWIAQNLGADHQAIAINDATEASSGWYWQFNRKQGYKYDGTTRTPNTAWITSIIENSDWISANDPCSIAISSAWRIPSYTEWNNVYNVDGWTNWTGPWNNALQLHAAGKLNKTNGILNNRGLNGNYWSNQAFGSFDNGTLLYFDSGSADMINNLSKAFGFPLRCLRD